MYILGARECKCDIAHWAGYIGTTRVHSLASMNMRAPQIGGGEIYPPLLYALSRKEG